MPNDYTSHGGSSRERRRAKRKRENELLQVETRKLAEEAKPDDPGNILGISTEANSPKESETGILLHIERVLGWDGLSFAFFFSLAVGLLAMDAFTPAKIAFSVSAVILARSS